MTTSTAPAPTKRSRRARKPADSVELTSAQAEAVKQLSDARRTKAAAERDEKAAKQVLEGLVDSGVVTGTVSGIPVVRFSPATWTGVDAKILQDAFPEAYTAASVSKPYMKINTV